jgi:steroid 5-alpha reductase family enzyme
MMLDVAACLAGLAAVLSVAVVTWCVSLWRRDVSIVDSVWPLFFLAAAITYAATTTPGPRTPLVLLLVAAWALRLSAYLTWRSWGEVEDRRYRAIRRRNEPGLAWKSLYLIFGLQGVLAAEGRVAWLDEQWERVDAWVAAHAAAETTAAAHMPPTCGAPMAGTG